MKFATTFVSVATLAGYVSAQTASAEDVGIVRQQLVNVVSTVTDLGNGVTAYASQADTPSLLAQSQAVLQTISAGSAAIEPIVGTIDAVTASTQLLDQVQALNAIVESTVNTAIEKKQVFVDACGGPTLLDQLQQLGAAAESFRGVIASKFDAANQGLVTQLSQPLIDSLQRAIDAYADQNSLASCSTTTGTPAEPSTTAAPEPSTTAAPKPSTTAAPEPSTSAPGQPDTCGSPSSMTEVEPPTVTDYPEEPVTTSSAAAEASTTWPPPAGECPPASTVTTTVYVTKDKATGPTKKPWSYKDWNHGGYAGGFKGSNPWENKNYRDAHV